MSSFLFGDEWKGTPAGEDMPFTDTPVGRPCDHCEELVQFGDSGLAEYVLEELLTPTTGVGRLMVRHRECYLQSIFGHQMKLCRCYGSSDPDVEGERLTKRQTALKVMAMFEMKVKQVQGDTTH